MGVYYLDRLAPGQTDSPATSCRNYLKFCRHIPVPLLLAHLTDVISVVGLDARVKPHRSRLTVRTFFIDHQKHSLFPLTAVGR
jgi:hypothetical protein